MLQAGISDRVPGYYHIIIMKGQQQSQSRNDYVNTLQSKASHTAPQSSTFVFHHDET